MKAVAACFALAVLTGCVTTGGQALTTACQDHYHAGRYREAIQACAAQEEALAKQQPPIEPPLLAEIMLVRARALMGDGQTVPAFKQVTEVAKLLKDEPSLAGRLLRAQAFSAMAEYSQRNGATAVMLKVAEMAQILLVIEKDVAVQAELRKVLAIRTAAAEEEFEKNRRLIETRLSMMLPPTRVVAGLIGQPEEVAAARARAPGRRSVRDHGMIAAAAFADGQYAVALTEFRQLLAQSPTEPAKSWALLGQAVSMVRLGQFAESLAVFDAILAAYGAQPVEQGPVPDLARLEMSGALIALHRLDDISPPITDILRRNSNRSDPQQRALAVEALLIRQSDYLIRWDGLGAWVVGQEIQRRYDKEPADVIEPLLALGQLQQNMAWIVRGEAKKTLDGLAQLESRYRGHANPLMLRIVVSSAVTRGLLAIAGNRYEEALAACRQARVDLDQIGGFMPRHIRVEMRGAIATCQANALHKTTGAAAALVSMNEVEDEVLLQAFEGGRIFQANFMVYKMVLLVEAKQPDAAQKVYQQIRRRFDPVSDPALEKILAPATLLHLMLQANKASTA